MEQYEVPAYNGKIGNGVVRHIMGRVGVKTGELMAVIITAEYDLPHHKELVKMLREAVSGLKSVVQNINKNQIYKMGCKYIRAMLLRIFSRLSNSKNGLAIPSFQSRWT